MTQKNLLAAAFLAVACFSPPGRAETTSDALVYYRQAEAGKPVVRDCEVAVYGGTSAGSIAAIQAARMGCKTILLSFNQHVGGLTSGGLTASDLGKAETIGGLALEFYTRLGGKTEFKSSAAEALYRTMLEEAGVTVLLGRCPNKVSVQNLDYGKLKERLLADGQQL